MVTVPSSAVSENNDQILLVGLQPWKKEMRSKDKETLVWGKRHNSNFKQRFPTYWRVAKRLCVPLGSNHVCADSA